MLNESSVPSNVKLLHFMLRNSFVKTIFYVLCSTEWNVKLEQDRGGGDFISRVCDVTESTYVSNKMMKKSIIIL